MTRSCWKTSCPTRLVASVRAPNPKTFAAVFAAMQEADEIINRDKRYAAEVYLKMAKTKETIESVLEILSDPEIEFTVTPKGTTKYLDFMFEHGRIKTKPSSWKGLFFPEAHNLPGN